MIWGSKTPPYLQERGLMMKEIDNVVDITETDNYDSYEAQGGEGGLPNPTAEDVGKVMRVKNGDESTLTTVVPTQTVEFTEEPVELENAVISAITAGAECIATINGKTYNGFASLVPGTDYVAISIYDNQTDEGFMFLLDNEALYFMAQSEETTFTVSLDIKTYNAVWSKDFSFDLIIHLDGNNLANATGATIISGTFADTVSKLAKGMPALVWVDGYCVNHVMYNFEQNQISIEMLNYVGSSQSAYVASTSGGSPTTRVRIPIISTLILVVHSDNTVAGWWDE